MSLARQRRQRKAADPGKVTLGARYLAAALACLLWLVEVVAAAAAATPAVLSLTPAERAWLAEHTLIRLAPDPDFPPIEFIDDEGSYRGIAADYARIVEQRLGIRFEIVRLKSWDEVLEKARRREVDLFGAASKSPQREEYLTFTRPHIELPGVIIVRNDVEGELRPEDLQHRRVAVVSGYVWQDLLLNDFPDLALHRVPDLRTGLKEVSFGSVDALVANLATASWYIQRDGITNLRVAGESGYFGRYAFAIRKDWPEFNRILEKALATITPAEHREILKRWVAVESGSSWLSWTSLMVIAGVFAMLLAVVAWNRSLKSLVRQRTRDLEEQLVQRREAERALDLANSELEQRVSDRTAELELSNQRLKSEIAERERIQEDLRRFQMTLDETLDSVFMFDARDLRFFYANQGAVDHVGYSRDELLAMTPYDIKPDFTEQAFREFIRPFLDGRQAVMTFETVHRHKSGAQIPVEIFLQYVAPENEPARFVAVVRDISERRRIEAKLAWNNRQLDIISQAQSAFITNTDPRAAFDTLLVGLLDLTGSEYGFIGEVLRMPDGAPYLRTYAITNIAWDEATRQFYQEHAPRGMEFTNLDTLFGAAIKTGTTVFANDPANDPRAGGIPHGHPPLNAFAGIPLYAGRDMVGLAGIANRAGGYDAALVDSLKPFIGTCANLIAENHTERQRIAAEQQVKHNAERLRAVLDNVLESIITIDQQGIVQSVNPATEQIFGYPPDEVVGQNVKMLMPEPHRSAHDQYLENYRVTGRGKIIGAGRELEARKKDGTLFPIEITVTEIAAAGQALYVGVLRDITERKDQESALLKAREALQRANEQLLAQSRTDALTGIANRRHFDELLEREIRRAVRLEDAPLSLILCDIDHFKLYNDRYGHIAGDECLKEVAQTITSVFRRAGDLVARYGGEEFAVVMPAAGGQSAVTVAEQLRRAVWERALSHAASPIDQRVTLSIGVATLPPGEMLSPRHFVALADEALYTAKANGRNRVESSRQGELALPGASAG